MTSYIRLCRQRIRHQLHNGFPPFKRADLPNACDIDQHAGIGCKTLFEYVQLALIEAVCSPAQEFIDS